MFLKPFLFTLCLSAATPLPPLSQTTTKPTEIMKEEMSPVSDMKYKQDILSITGDFDDIDQKKTKAIFVIDNGVREDSGGRYYVRNGIKVKNSWITDQGTTYYASRSGKLISGWFTKDGKTYYFDQKCRLQTGWIYVNQNWYYAPEKEIIYGWHEIPSSDGTKNWYYFDLTTGAMVTDDMTPDGYYVNADGVWIERLTFPESDYIFAWESSISGQEPGSLSGLAIAGMPAEFYMLTIAGETSGGSNTSAIVAGDRGRAYGFCQFDYRYDLVGFMRYAYERHPELWSGFRSYLQCHDGDEILVNNEDIGNAFLQSITLNANVSVEDQLSYIRKLYWDGFSAKLNRAGYRLSERHIAVSAALLSVNVNCGPQAVLFLSVLDPSMSDEEMIDQIYRVRNLILSEQYVNGVKKGTTMRYMVSEPQMALDLLYGYTTIDSYKNYGGGVEWHGNPFSEKVSTQEIEKPIEAEESGSTSEMEDSANSEEPIAEPSEETESQPDTETLSEDILTADFISEEDIHNSDEIN